MLSDLLASPLNTDFDCRFFRLPGQDSGLLQFEYIYMYIKTAKTCIVLRIDVLRFYLKKMILLLEFHLATETLSLKNSYQSRKIYKEYQI